MTMAEITGRQVLAFTVGAFGVIIAVNLVMAWQAVSTFPGLEVDNSYVASQEFDRRRAAQEALGWTVAASHDRGRLRIGLSDAGGRAVQVSDMAVLVGRTTSNRDDVTPQMTFADGAYTADLPLAGGYWMVKITAHAMDGTLFERRIDLLVRG